MRFWARKWSLYRFFSIDSSLLDFGESANEKIYHFMYTDESTVAHSFGYGYLAMAHFNAIAVRMDERLCGVVLDRERKYISWCR